MNWRACAGPATAHEGHRWPSLCTQSCEGRQGREGVTVAVIGVTGDKCADCGLLIGTKTYIYNRWLKLGEHSHLAKSSPHTKDTCTVQSDHSKPSSPSSVSRRPQVEVARSRSARSWGGLLKTYCNSAPGARAAEHSAPFSLKEGRKLGRRGGREECR